MTDYDTALLKCMEELSTMVLQVAVLESERMSEREVGEFDMAYRKWKAAHRDLKRAMEEGKQ